MYKSRHHSIVYLSVIVLLLLTNNMLPGVAKESLLIRLSAQRIEDGGIIFVGQVKLPKGTKMMIDLSLKNKILGQDKITINDGGNFKSNVFRNGEKSHSTGTYQVNVISYFSKIWQSSEVLKIVGENGASLPSVLLAPDDPEFPNAGRHFEVTLNVVFPNIAPAQQAIQAVQEAYLSIPDRGRSADPVKDVVTIIRKGGGFYVLSWEANQSSPGVWVVTLNCTDAGKKKKAQWEYNTKTKKVKYLDPLAKNLSWTPSE